MKQKVPSLPSSDEAAKHNKAKGPVAVATSSLASPSPSPLKGGIEDMMMVVLYHPPIPPDSDTAEEEKLKADIHNFRRERVIDLKFSCCMI